MLVSLRAVRGNKGFSFLANYWKRSMNWTLLIFVNHFLELWSIQGQRYHTLCPPTKVTTYPWYILVFIQVDGLKDVAFRYPYFITEGQKESNVLHLQHSRKEQIIKQWPDIEKTTESWRGLCKECAVCQLNWDISTCRFHFWSTKNLLGIFSLPKYVLWSRPKTLQLRVSQVTL